MPSNRKRVGWVGSVLLGMLLLTMLVTRGQSRAGRVITFVDGSQLILRGVTTGTIHYEPPRLWSLALDHTPARVRSALRLPGPVALVTAEPALILWTSEQIGAGHPPAERIRFGVVDENGFEVLLPWRRISGVNARLDGQQQIATRAWFTSLYPRHTRRLRIRVYEASEKETLRLAGEWKVSLRGNPKPARKARPSPLPLSRRTGREEFVLCRFESLPTDPTVSGSSAQTELRFDVNIAGRRSAAWTVGEIVLSNTVAPGNLVRIGDSPEADFPLESEWQENGLRCRFPWPLWLDEPAYAMRVEFVRSPAAVLPPDEVLDVKGVPVPSADGVSMINGHASLQGIEVKLLALVGDQATLPGREHDVFGQTTLEVDVPPLPDDTRFDVVRVTGNQGHPARQVMALGNQSYGFKIDDGVQTVDIRVAVSKRRVVEYLVRPAGRTGE